MEASVSDRWVRVGEAGAHGGIGEATRRSPFRGKVSRTMGRPLSRHPRGRNPSRYYGNASPQARDLHTLVTIPALPSATVTVGSGSMIGTAITKVLRGPGAALSVLVLCAVPAAAQFSFPFGAPPPNPVPAPNAAPAPNTAARSQACLRLESQPPPTDRGAGAAPARADQVKRNETPRPNQLPRPNPRGRQ